MPNYVYNTLKFDCTPERFREIAESLKENPEDPLGKVDFNTLIPMPASLHIEYSGRGKEGHEAYKEFIAQSLSLSEVEKDKLEKSYRKRFSKDPETWELGKQYYQNTELYGAPHWWDWAREHWNSPYSAYSCRPIQPEDRELEFTTSWVPVPNILYALSEKYPDVVITYTWYVSAPCCTGGKAVFQGGECIAFYKED